MNDILRLSGVVNDSIVDGSGIRLAIFTQGCPHGCAGCHNPQTHDKNGGYDEEAQVLYDRLCQNPLAKGITLSGGEPFMQAVALIPLCRAVKAIGNGRAKDIWIYSGFLYEQLLNDVVPGSAELLRLCDVLVDGKFEQERLNLNLWYRGSSNQRVIDVKSSLECGEVVIFDFPDS